MRMILKRIFFYSVLLALPFLAMEGLFRLLPVSNSRDVLPVSAQNPVARMRPNTGYLFSKDWNFSIRARKHTNNFGYNHVSDYRPDETTPLLMVIGDSFVEGYAVDAGKSAAEILHSGVDGHGRVYSVGVSEAPLSQYLVFAEFSRTTFRPAAMAFVITENDFDESLLKYKSLARFHYFEEAQGGLVLRRVDYQPSTARTILRKSAFVRYVMLNLGAIHIYNELARRLLQPEQSRLWDQAGAALESRIRDSKRAIDHFLDQVAASAGLDSRSIVFVLDAVRPAIYSPQALQEAGSGYFAQMRRYFKDEAGARGFEVLDMQPVFIGRHRADNSRFEFRTDCHWNELANQLVAEEIRKSALFRRILGNGEH